MSRGGVETLPLDTASHHRGFRRPSAGPYYDEFLRVPHSKFSPRWIPLFPDKISATPMTCPGPQRRRWARSRESRRESHRLDDNSRTGLGLTASTGSLRDRRLLPRHAVSRGIELRTSGRPAAGGVTRGRDPRSMAPDLACVTGAGTSNSPLPHGKQPSPSRSLSNRPGGPRDPSAPRLRTPPFPPRENRR